jgi:TRAP-type uncharacterized transport system substrate-binding protein
LFGSIRIPAIVAQRSDSEAVQSQLKYLLLVSLFIASGCSRGEIEFRMARPISTVDREITTSLADLFNTESRFAISLTDDQMSGEDALDALIAGETDIALVSNALPYRDGVTAVIPLFPSVLHIGYIDDRNIDNVEDLLRGARVYAGDVGSASRMMFLKSVENSGVATDDFEFVDDPETGSPNVFVVFAPIAPDILKTYQDKARIRLYSVASPADLGRGSRVDTAILLNPYLRPFIIPVGTYGDATSEPVLTVAVDKMIVARSDLEAADVYNFISELLRLRPALAATRPALFKDLTGDFDAGRSTFVLHPGAQAYVERSEPTFLERYSGVAEVAVTVFIGLVSAIFGALRIYDRKRKNRIDRFYSEVLEIRNTPPGTDQDRQTGILRIRELQNEAFEQLVNEKLAADESFRIFITLSNDVLHQLGAMAARGTTADD